MSGFCINSGKFRQFITAIIVNLSALSLGVINGWSSPVTTILQSAESPVGSPMSYNSISWMSGFVALGGTFFAPFSSLLIERLGRKGFGYATCGPLILSWIILTFAPSLQWIFIGRFLAGVSGAMAIFLVPIYVSEIASENIRGVLASFQLFAINVGILIAFVAGPLLSYRNFTLFCGTFPFIFLVTFFFLPETPVYLLQQKQIKEAYRSLMFFRGNDEELVNIEISHLLHQVTANINRVEKLGLSYLIKDSATFKGMVIMLGILSGQQCSGIIPMIYYAERIFKISGSSMSPSVAAIIIGCIQIFGSYLSTILMERAGRRPLILLSCAGMSICHFTIAAFCYFQKIGYDLSCISMIPVLSLSSFMISYCLGIGPIPFVLASEIFSVNITSLANTVCSIFLWVMAFIIVTSFESVIELIGIDGCFLILGICCAISILFTFFMVPETRGCERLEIIKMLAAKQRATSNHNEIKLYI